MQCLVRTAGAEEVRGFEVALMVGPLEDGLILEEMGIGEGWVDGGDEA